MPEVDYVILSEWFDWLIRNIDISVDLIGKTVSPCPLLEDPLGTAGVRFPLAETAGRDTCHPWFSLHHSSPKAGRI